MLSQVPGNGLRAAVLVAAALDQVVATLQRRQLACSAHARGWALPLCGARLARRPCGRGSPGRAPRASLPALSRSSASGPRTERARSGHGATGRSLGQSMHAPATPASHRQGCDTTPGTGELGANC